MTQLQLLAALLIPTLAACGERQSLTKQGENSNLADRMGNEAKDGDDDSIPDKEVIADFQVKISQVADKPCTITEQRDNGLVLFCSANNEHYTFDVEAGEHSETPLELIVDVVTEDGTRLIACEGGKDTSELDTSRCLLRLVREGNTYTGSVQVEGPAVETPTLPDLVAREATDLIEQTGEGTAEVKDKLEQTAELTAEQVPAAREAADGWVARAKAASQLKWNQAKDIYTYAFNKAGQAVGAAAAGASKSKEAASNAMQNINVKIADRLRNDDPQAARKALERLGHSER